MACCTLARGGYIMRMSPQAMGMLVAPTEVAAKAFLTATTNPAKKTNPPYLRRMIDAATTRAILLDGRRPS